MGKRVRHNGFTLLELLISLAVVALLLTVLMPVLDSARASSHRVLCASNQRLLGEAWVAYLEASQGRFPAIYMQPAWHFGGVRFSTVDGSPGRPIAWGGRAERVSFGAELVALRDGLVELRPGADARSRQVKVTKAGKAALEKGDLQSARADVSASTTFRWSAGRRSCWRSGGSA